MKINIEFRPVMECLVALKNDGDRITSGNGGIPGNGFTLSSDGRSNVHFSYAQLYVDKTLSTKVIGQKPLLVY